MLASIWRGCRRSPSSFGLLVVTCALCSAGAGLAITLFDFAVVRALPYNHAEEVVVVDRLRLAYSAGKVSFESDLLAVPGFVSWGLYRTGTMALGRNAPVLVSVAGVNSGFFETLGAIPMRGRLFGRDEDTGRIAVVSRGLWQSHLGEAELTASSSLILDGTYFTVVGVLADDFRYPGVARVWIPINEHRFLGAERPRAIARRGRLTSDKQARALLAPLLPGAGRANPVEGIVSLREDLSASERPLLGVIGFLGLGLILLISLNLAAQAVADAVRRREELVLRLALGASRYAIAVEISSTALAASVSGTLIGCTLVYLNGGTLLSFLAPRLHELRGIVIDARVVAVSALAAASMVFVGAAGSWRLSSLRILRPGPYRMEAERAGVLLVVLQLAMVAATGTAAAATTRVVGGLMNVDLGTSLKGTVLTTIVLPRRYLSHEHAATFIERLEANNEGLMVGAATTSFSESAVASARVEMESLSPEKLDSTSALTIGVSPHYLTIFGVPLLKGRAFTASDRRESRSVALISESLATRMGASPTSLPFRAKVDGQPVEVVGVVGDVRVFGPRSQGSLALYRPLAQFQRAFRGTLTLAIASMNAHDFREKLNRALQSDTVGVGQFETIDDIRSQFLRAEKRAMAIALASGLLIVTVAIVGAYFVTSRVVDSRVLEYAIRGSLGATRLQLAGLALSYGVRLAVAGTAVGVGSLLTVTHFIGTRLIAPQAGDWGAGALAAFLVALMATAGPAWRASGIQPIVLLRS